MEYKTIQDKHGFFVVDRDSAGIPTSDKLNRITPNLNENELKVNFLKVEGCPIGKTCVSLVGIDVKDRITHVCKYYQVVIVPMELIKDKSHAYVVCNYKKESGKA